MGRNSWRLQRSILAAGVILAAAGAVGLLPAGSAQAAPEPSIVPISWELNLRHGPLERLIMTIDGKQRTFWYMRYTVINNSGRDVLFTPEFELQTETGEVVQGFKDVPKGVFEKIKGMSNNEMLQSPTGVLGKLLQGEDNAKDGVIIFKAPESDARIFQVFVSGLSGETAEVKNPLTGQTEILQKTLVMEYNVPGQAIGIRPQPELRSTRWVMK
jgi:hypothetical protein